MGKTSVRFTNVGGGKKDEKGIKSAFGIFSAWSCAEEADCLQSHV